MDSNETVGILLNLLFYAKLNKGDGFVDKKTQILNVIFATILFFCSLINIIKNYLNIPEWLHILTGLFLIIGLVLLVVIVVRIIRYRKENK